MRSSHFHAFSLLLIQVRFHTIVNIDILCFFLVFFVYLLLLFYFDFVLFFTNKMRVDMTIDAIRYNSQWRQFHLYPMQLDQNSVKSAASSSAWYLYWVQNDLNGRETKKKYNFKNNNFHQTTRPSKLNITDNAIRSVFRNVRESHFYYYYSLISFHSLLFCSAISTAIDVNNDFLISMKRKNEI